MKIKPLFFSVIPILVLFAATSGSPEQNRIKIGIISDVTGPIAWWGKGAFVGAKLAEEDIEKRGGMVDIIYGDSGLNPSKGVAELQKMLALNRIDTAFIDVSPIAIATAPLLRDSGKIAIHSSTSTEANRINPGYFKVYLDYEEGCAAVAREWKRQSIAKVGLLKFNGELGDRCLGGVRTIFPKATTFPYNMGDDMVALATLAKSRAIEAVMLAGFGPDIEQFIGAADRLNFRPLYGGSQGDVLMRGVISHYKNALEGAVTFWFTSLPEEFAHRVLQEEPSLGSEAFANALLTFVHIQQLFNAINSCPSRNPVCIAEKLSESSPDDRLGFKGFYNRIAHYAIELKRFKSGKQETITAK